MLVPTENLAKHAAVLQCIAYDFREHADRQGGGGYDDFASLLEHIAATLIVGPGSAQTDG
jgi:hypothetical protein